MLLPPARGVRVWLLGVPGAGVKTLAASVIDTEEYITTSYSRGFPVGYMDATKGHYLYNHVNIIVKYHELSIDANRVVGFYVEPFSVKHKFVDDVKWNGDRDFIPALETCDLTHPMDLDSIHDERTVEGEAVLLG